MSDQDWTRGEDIPVEDMVIGSDAAFDTDAKEVAENNVSGTLAPGNYVLRVVGFGKNPEKVLKTVYVNGQAGNYESIQIGVILADVNNTGTMFQNLIVPPNDARQMALYTHGKKEPNSKSEGFFANQFVSFLGNLIPGSIVKGEPMKPVARNLKNWIGKKVWAQVEMDKGGYVKPGVNKLTGKAFEPTEPRPQIKLFSFREYIEGGPCPYTTNPAFKPGDKFKAASKPAPPLVGSGVSANGTGHAVDDGLGDI